MAARRPPDGSRSGNSPPATAASCRCSTARTSCWRSPARSRSPTSPRRRAPCAEGPYDLSLVEGSITTAHDAERIREVRAAVEARWSPSAPAPPPAASRRCATSPTSKSSSPRSMPRPIHPHAGDLDADLGACAGRFRAARLPDQQAPAARGDLAPSWPGASRRSPAHSVCIECKLRGTVCVMVRRARPASGPVTHAGCGAICPAYDRGCYGCFGPMETPNTAVAGPRMAALRRRASATIHRVFRTFNAGGRTVPRRRARRHGDVRRSRSTTSPASKARARSTSISATARCDGVRAVASSSRRASSRRCCAGAATPRPPTSPRASAASARSPTR